MSFNLGTILKSINFDKNDLIFEGEDFKGYSSFVVDRSLSYFPDTLGIAARLSKYGSSTIPPELHYLCWLHDAPTRKRFARWHKATNPKLAAVISEIYKVNLKRAEEYLNCMNEEQIKEIKNIQKAMEQ